eukprot:79753-Pelagomonas_calceolata.AAC.8
MDCMPATPPHFALLCTFFLCCSQRLRASNNNSSTLAALRAADAGDKAMTVHGGSFFFSAADGNGLHQEGGRLASHQLPRCVSSHSYHTEACACIISLVTQELQFDHLVRTTAWRLVCKLGRPSRMKTWLVELSWNCCEQQVPPTPQILMKGDALRLQIGEACLSTVCMVVDNHSSKSIKWRQLRFCLTHYRMAVAVVATSLTSALHITPGCSAHLIAPFVLAAYLASTVFSVLPICSTIIHRSPFLSLATSKVF